MNDLNKHQSPNFDNFEEEQVGFPPYWKAGWVRPPKGEFRGEGKWFYGQVVSFDGRDPNFERWIIRAGLETECASGPVREQVAVTVRPGQQFSVSAYGGLPLEKYLGVNVRVRVTGEQDTGKPNPMWVFSISVSPETKKLLATPDYQAKLARAQRDMRMLPPPHQRTNPREVNLPSEDDRRGDDDIPF